MEPDKDTNQKETGTPQAPADALSRTPEDLEQAEAEQKAADGTAQSDTADEQKISPIKRFFRRINVYLLLFLLLVVVAGVVSTVDYLNNKKADSSTSDTVKQPDIASQKLTENALKQLANSDTSVSSASQTLTIQGNAIIEGQTLMRGNLNVAGNFQSGGRIQGPSLTISGDTNLGTTQINSLQVAQNTTIQGATTLRDLSVAGTASFSGPVSTSQLTVSKLILSGNSVIEVPNHLAFTGAPAGRGAVGGAVGSGGSASVNGSDTSGTVNINTGGGTAAGCFVRINFARAFGATPRVIVSPIGAGAGATQFYVDRDTTGFSICASSPAPTGQSFAFDYFVAGT